MAHELYELLVKKINRETEDCVTVELEVPAALKELFLFTQGQYLTFEKELDGESIRRSYSICSAPSEQRWCVVVKEVHNGKFSTFINRQLKIGDRLSVLPPGGRFFTKLEKQNQKFYVFFAAGSGITPILSIIKEILFVEPNSSILLFYGNQKTEHIIFLESLMSLKNLYPSRLSLHFILSRELMEEPMFNGRIDGAKLKAFAKNLFDIREVDEFFMCGPETMILELRESLIALGVNIQNIHMELFGVQVQKPKPIISYASEKDSCLVRMTLDGRTFEYALPFNTESILDSALRQGAHLPFACKGGVCCTCKTKLLSGHVEMLVNYGLEPDELKNGYILSCQAFPTSDTVVVNFDV
ncbi:MAG: 2Fe-2S iron-sulfur cluster binding domain-containing protein [Saprospiraceae bacterium]|nr:2Fe-2S iron-sulfur cluster binding domain-containing protein [Saprospiraceae bacterium]